MIKNYGLSGLAPTVQLGKNGIEIADQSGVFAVLKSGSLVRIQSAAPLVAADVVNKEYLEQELSTLTSGVGFSGSYTPNTFAHYINTATSLKNADDLLDAAVFEFEGKLAGFATTVGIDGSGNLVIPASTYLSGSTTVMQAAGKLDVALKAVSDDVARIKTASGFNANGSYSNHTGTNYINGATSVKNADVLLDSAIADVSNTQTAALATIGLVGTSLPNLSATNYISAASSVMNAIVVLDSQIKTITGNMEDIDKVFVYHGSIAGGAQETPTLLDSQNPSVGHYLRVSASGWFKFGAGAAFYANTGDGMVFNNTNTWDIVDNTNSVVAGTNNRIVVSGSPDTGYSIDIAANYVGQNTITTLGTVTTGTWEGSTIAASRGGTGHSTYSVGDILIGGTLNTLKKLSRGAANSVLKVNFGGTDVEWGTLTATNITYGGGTVSDALSDNKTLVDAIVAGAGLHASGGYVADTSTNYLKTASSLKDADKKLDAAIYAISQQITSMMTDEIQSTGSEYSVKAAAASVDVLGPTGNGKQTFLKFESVAGGSTSYARLTIRGTETDMRLVSRVGASPAPLKLDVSELDASSAVIKNVGTATQDGDAINLGQAKSTFQTVAIATVAEGTSGVSVSTINGMVTRVTVKITSPFNAASLATVGTAGDNSLLVGASDIDTTVAGTYVVDLATTVNGAVFWYNGTTGTGAATLIIEYLAQS